MGTRTVLGTDGPRAAHLLVSPQSNSVHQPVREPTEPTDASACGAYESSDRRQRFPSAFRRTVASGSCSIRASISLSKARGVRKQYEVIGIRAGYSNTAWIDFITTDDQCGGVHFKLARRLWGSILTMKRANVSQEPLIARTRDAPTRERPGLGMGVTACGVSVRA